MTWTTLLSGTGSSEFLGFISDHPDPLTELINSRLLPVSFISGSANMREFIGMIIVLFLVMSVFITISMIIYNLCIPVIRIMAGRW